jgi:hypothetical protein
MRSRFTSKWIAVVLLSFSTVVIASETSEEKIAELLPVSPVAITSSGAVLSYLQNFGDLFAYDPSTDKTTTVYRNSNVNSFGTAGLAFDVASNASVMTMLVYSPFGQAKVLVVELDKPGFPSSIVPETRGLNFSPRVSPDGQQYMFAGRLDPQSWGTESLWTFNLSEYLWDASQSVAQPTGFYLYTVIGAPADAGADRLGRVSNHIPSIAWSADATEVAYVVSGFEGRNNSTTLNVHNLLTQKTRQIAAVSFNGRMEWPAGNSIYYLQTQGGSGPVFRMDLEKLTSETVVNDTVEASTLAFFQNGEWMAYATMGVSPGTGTATLFDIKAKKAIRLKGASGLRVAPDNETIVLQRSHLDAQKRERPFWIAKFADLLAANKNGTVDLAALEKRMAVTGEGIPSYEPPSEKAGFDKRFSLQNVAVTQSPQYVSASAMLKNVSDRYYSFKIQGFEAARCNLKDEQGNVLGESFVRASPNQETKQVLGPNRTLPMYCSVVLRTLPPAGTVAKFTMQLNGYENQMSVERDITL